MTAQPSSQAEREDVAREVLATVLADGGYPNEAADVRNGLGVELNDRWAIRAMLAFRDREHTTPRSMPEEVVEAYERAAKVAEDHAAELEKRAHVLLGWTVTQGRLDSARRIAAAIRGLIPGASA